MPALGCGNAGETWILIVKNVVYDRVDLHGHLGYGYSAEDPAPSGRHLHAGRMKLGNGHT
jgi:hypothetical protein